MNMSIGVVNVGEGRKRFKFIFVTLVSALYFVSPSIYAFLPHTNHTGTLSIPEFEEDYVITYPSAYARSILTVPWTELGGRCSITCEKTGLTASILFQTKPMYGGQPHK